MQYISHTPWHIGGLNTFALIPYPPLPLGPGSGLNGCHSIHPHRDQNASPHRDQNASPKHRLFLQLKVSRIPWLLKCVPKKTQNTVLFVIYFQEYVSLYSYNIHLTQGQVQSFDFLFSPRKKSVIVAEELKKCGLWEHDLSIMLWILSFWVLWLSQKRRGAGKQVPCDRLGNTYILETDWTW